jgi:hypothetical protein
MLDKIVGQTLQQSSSEGHLEARKNKIAAGKSTGRQRMP